MFGGGGQLRGRGWGGAEVLPWTDNWTDRWHRRVTCRVAPCEQQGATKKEKKRYRQDRIKEWDNLLLSKHEQWSAVLGFQIKDSCFLNHCEPVCGLLQEQQTRSNSVFRAVKNWTSIADDGTYFLLLPSPPESLLKEGPLSVMWAPTEADIREAMSSGFVPSFAVISLGTFSN